MESKSIFWVLHHVLFISLLVFVLWASGLNDAGLKYTKSRSSVSEVFSGCKNLILELTSPDSWICCDQDMHNDLWVCAAAFDSLTRAVSGYWAWILPVLPLMGTFLVDSVVDRLRTLQETRHTTSSSRNRLLLYVAIILVRTIVLYILPFTISGMLSSDSELVCWCKDFVSKTKCQMQFDFSDHIVLFTVQFIYPSYLEAFHILSTHDLLFGTTNASSQRLTRTAYDIAKHFYWIPLTISFAIIAMSLRSMLYTMLFFHTPLENISAIVIALIFPYLFFLFGPQRKIIEKEFSP